MGKDHSVINVRKHVLYKYLSILYSQNLVRDDLYSLAAKAIYEFF